MSDPRYRTPIPDKNEIQPPETTLKEAHYVNAKVPIVAKDSGANHTVVKSKSTKKKWYKFWSKDNV